MRLPRIIIGASGYIRLWQSQRRETARLRRQLVEMRAERDEWRDKLLAKAGMTPLFTPKPPPSKSPEPLIVGPAAKRAYLESRKSSAAVPTAEEIMAVRNGN